MSDTAKVLLPFDGFYNSTSESIIDWAFEDEIEELKNEINSGENEKLKPLLNIENFEGYIVSHIDYRYPMIDYCNMYVKAFNDLLDASGYKDIKCTTPNLISPKYYNYETDKLEVEMKKSDLKKIFEQEFGAEENFTYFKDAVIMKMKSREGFASFYDDFANKVEACRNIEDFYKEFKFEELDDNHLSMILLAFTLDHPELHGESLQLYFLYEEAFEDLTQKCSGYLDQAAEKALKYLKSETKG